MMPQDLEHYVPYYAEKLWNLIPAVYRTTDTVIEVVDPHQPDKEFDELPGPLREMVDRIAVQVAAIRRSIDRTWEDQTIEACDDWIIPYIGDLLGTNLVASLDPRGRRLDVANTIYYRRRAGTVGILEEIAHDITNWDARVVEFFRRLARSRHGLDPEVGISSAGDDPVGHAALRSAEGLIGRSSGTPMGGYADLRSVYGASKVGTAFDEFSHLADLRRGRARAGWYSIPSLGVFVWRLKSFAVTGSTPRPCITSGLYSFDPTGRLAPLFARPARTKEAAYGDRWVSSEEWQMPGPLRKSLYESEHANLYPDSVEVLRKAGAFYDGVDVSDVTIYPELGTFRVATSLQTETLLVNYHYGFCSLIGAGPYDRRNGGQPAGPAPATTVTGGGVLPALPTGGSTTIGDSQTYDSAADVIGIQELTLRSANRQRPLLRLDSWQPWTLEGAADSSRLLIDGIFISGGDIVISGDFDTVSLRSVTLDPGTSGAAQDPPITFATSVHGEPLKPSRLWVEGDVRLLQIERSITGPIRTRAKGSVERIEVSDSIIQGIRTEDFGDFIDLKDAERLLRRLHAQKEPLSTYLWSRLQQAQPAITSYLAGGASAPNLNQVSQLIANDLSAVINSGASIYSASRFALVTLDAGTRALAAAPPPGTDLVRLNRTLLESAYPTELADLALSSTTGIAALERCTVLGPAYLHRIEASECILDDRVMVEDAQHGCLRFTAWATDSVLPRLYESVQIAPAAPLFTSVDLGQPGYAQLLSNADRQIVAPAGQGSITEGGPTGSEMGAFASEINGLRQRSLLLKYQEFMPLGLSPVVVNVT